MEIYDEFCYFIEQKNLTKEFNNYFINIPQYLRFFNIIKKNPTFYIHPIFILNSNMSLFDKGRWIEIREEWLQYLNYWGSESNLLCNGQKIMLKKSLNYMN